MLPTTQTRTNLTTASAVIKYCEVPDALAAQVAAQQGVTLSTPGVTWTCCCHNADGYHVIVTVDHEARGARMQAAASDFPNPALRANAIQAAAQQAAEARTPAAYWQQCATGLGGGQGFLVGGVNQETSQQQPGTPTQQQPTRYDDPTKPDAWTAQQAAYWAQPGDNLFPEFKPAAEAAFQQPGASLQGTQEFLQQARGAARQQQPPVPLPERIERDKRNNARTVALRNLADAFHQGRAAPASPSAVGYVESLVAAAERALGDPTAPPTPTPKAPWPFPPNPAPNEYGRR